LRIYDAGDFKGRLEVEILGGAVGPFRWQAAQFLGGFRGYTTQ
jgi:hypothetical protein